MLKKSIYSVLLIIVFFGAGYWYTYSKEAKTPVTNAINAIPINATFILESKNIKSVWEELSETNIIWEQLMGLKSLDKLNQELHFVDSLISSNSDIVSFLDDHPFLISAHVSGAQDFGFLCTYSLPSVLDQEVFDDFFYKSNHNIAPTVRSYDGATISIIHSKNGQDSLSYSFLEGVLMMSVKPDLVEGAIRQLNSGASLLSDKNISKIIKTAGKNEDANLYVNFKNVPEFFKEISSSTFKKQLGSLPHFASFGGWDVSIKANAFMLSGFAQAEDVHTSFLSLFAKQKPQEITLTNILPSTTAQFSFWGISNLKTFHHDYKNYVKANNKVLQYKRDIEKINKRYHIDIETDMLKWVNNEIAFVRTQSFETKKTDDNVYAVFRSNNIESAVAVLDTLTSTINFTEKQPTKTLKHQDVKISQLPLPNILTKILGASFSSITNNYYCAIEDYVIMGNSKNALANFIDAYTKGKILSNDKHYQAFSENIASEANLYYYSSIARSPGIYKECLNDELAKEVDDKVELLRKFEAAAIQFTTAEGMFYSNGYFNYNPVKKQEHITLWEHKLDTTVSSKPHLVINHRTNNKEILVQDDDNKIYLISNTGKTIWTRQLDEKIQSDVTQVDVFKNKKLQMVFNTKSKIYNVDRNGNDVGGFPIQLKTYASNTVSVFDYERNRKYRIFIACESGRVYCFDAKGKEVKGFEFKRAKNKVTFPITFFRVNGKDYLCIVDEKGIVSLLNRRGEARVKLKERFPTVQDFYVAKGKDQSRTSLVGIDNSGNVITLGLNNDKGNNKIDNFDSIPFFAYRDINSDKTKEYVFVQNTTLQVFSSSKTLMYDYVFDQSIQSEPLFFSLADGQKAIGVVSKLDNELFLFNQNGKLLKGFPISGNTPFSIGDVNRDGKLNIVTGSNNSIYLYQLDVE